MIAASPFELCAELSLDAVAFRTRHLHGDCACERVFPPVFLGNAFERRVLDWSCFRQAVQCRCSEGFNRAASFDVTLSEASDVMDLTIEVSRNGEDFDAVCGII